MYGAHTSTEGAAPGLLAETYSTSLNAVGIRGRIASNAPGEDSVAVHGENFGARSAGIGVWGEHRGSGIGVYGSSESGTGVLGRINFTSTSFGSVAVRGENNATGLNDVGVWGSQAGSGRGVVGTSPNGVGVYGRSQSGYGVIGDSFSGYGVVGNSGSNVGVKGSSGSRNGVQGFSSTGNGVYANSARGYALRANRGVSADAILPNHVALINNTSTGNSADVLALKIDYTGTPTGGNNFITFFKGGDAPVGAIQGNGSGGIELHSGSADYAEWLPKLQPAERLRPGEIVGVHGARVTKQTAGADRPMVVSSGPIVLGNDPGAGKRDRYVQIALFGQVIVRVWGPITARDLIVPSGRMDGTGVAVRPEAASLVQLASFVGEAWSGAAGSGLHRVRVAVG